MEPTPLTMAAALAQSVQEINESRTLDDTFDAVVRAARTSIPAFEHVSISVRSADGKLETKAGTDQLVWELDAVQYDNGEGPCVKAIEQEPVVVVEHLRHEQRWPRYIPAAVQRGVRSQVGVQVFTQGKHLGGLNLYSTAHDEVDQESVDTARLFATHVAVILGHVQEEQHLYEALQSRKTIGQAVGIIMERYRIDEDRAFQFLLRASSTSNIKVRDVATELVTSSTERYRPRT
jgi:GAF domain-containing protein